jgi:4'-phosphopantetheinyl transferase
LSLDENRPAGNAPPSLRIRALPQPVAGVAVWWCELAASPPDVEACFRWLSESERARAARFGQPKLRDRYDVGRASLRRILGDTLGLPPASVPIVRGPRGRPRLDMDATLDFNVSHTGDVAVITIVRDARVGVDVERLDRIVNVAGIARKFLTPGEQSALARLDADAARRTLLALWTCKEAMSKATGDALSAPFASIDVHLADVPTLVAGPGVYAPERWTLHRASVPPEYVATVALWRDFREVSKTAP